MTAELDTSTLPADEAATLDALVDAALAEGEPPPADPRARDAQHYEITVGRPPARTVLNGSDPHLPPAFRALVATLQPHATPTR
jgi:hypothetical protein